MSSKDKFTESDRKPSDFMRERRPESFSDSKKVSEIALAPKLLEYVLETLTSRKEEVVFEHFCRKLLEKEICPNLVIQTGPTGGGDSKVDSETYPVSEMISDSWYVGDPSRASKEKWAFAFSAKKDWRQKVKKDIDSICSTGRSYELIYFVSNQFIKDKDRAEVEDELKSKFGVPVKILDRSWIVEKVIENGHVNLAVRALDIQGVNSSDVAIEGPRDLEKRQELEELERQIADSDRYKSASFQFVEDCIEAALLSRDLERPRAEVDGKFGRAVRNAQKSGIEKQQLRALYQHAWTSYYWFDDADEMLRLYSQVESLSNLSDVDDLESLSNLLMSLKGALQFGLISENDTDIGTKWSKLKLALNAIEKEKGRPSSSLRAESIRLVHELHAAYDNPKAIDDILTRFIEIIRAGGSSLDFPVVRIMNLVREFEPIAGDSKVFESLFDLVVETSQERAGDTAAGEIVLKRASRLFQSGRSYDALKLFGKAQVLFSKAESQNELIAALVGCGQIYFEKGLLWAAKASLTVATERLVSSFWKNGKLDAKVLLCIRKIIWIEILLGRVPVVLSWVEILNVLERQTLLSDEKADLHNQERVQQDAILGILLLKTSDVELALLESLPSVCDELGLVASETASLFALGQVEELKKRKLVPQQETERQTEDFFVKWLQQPAAEELKSEPLFINGSAVQFETNILGCNVCIEGDNEIASIVFAETILATLETMFASSIEGTAYPHRSSFKISLRLIKDGATWPSFQTSQSSQDANVLIEIPANLTPIFLTIESRDKFRDWLLELSFTIFTRIAILKNTEEFLERLYKEEKAVPRALLFGDLWLMIGNIFGDRKKFQLMHWESTPERTTSVNRIVSWMDSIPRVAGKNEEPPDQTVKVRDFKDVEQLRHDSIDVHSIIDVDLWDRAKWQGVMYFVHPDFPPAMILGFKNISAGREIFKSLDKKVGREDREEQIRIAVVKGILRDNPHSYGVNIGANISKARHSPDKQFVLISRVNRMNPQTSENLDRFMDVYRKHGRFILAPGKMGDLNGIVDEVNRFGIMKKDLEVKDAWTIEANDFDLSVLDEDEVPVIPIGIKDPPVLKALEALRGMRKKKDR